MTRSPTAGSGRTRVVVIGGGQSCEHEVSISTAAAVAGGLDRTRYDVDSLTIGRDGCWTAAGGPLAGGMAGGLEVIRTADVVFPAVHGPRGEDGTLAALCELAGIPYVGFGVRAGALAMDKWATKLVASSLGIRTASSVLVSRTDPVVVRPPPLPLVVKPVSGGSSYGVSRVDRPEDLDRAVRQALLIDERALVEAVAPGREIDIAVLDRGACGRLVGPALEIVVEPESIFDTDTKYDGTADFRVPAEITAAEHGALADAATAMFDALGCAGVARFDFFLSDGEVVLNEVNTMPGLTERSQVPTMFASVGIPYAELLDLMIDATLDRRASW